MDSENRNCQNCKQEFIIDFYKDHKTNDGKDFMPYEHQVDAIFKILKHQFGIVEIATAGGKSLVFGTLLFYYLKYVKMKKCRP